ncbi:uncharacterized protein MONBRDRAFT_31877 [Monosiga brevicollis MX1]|uniref:Tumor necrosis factor alpha-induced protein 8-like protein n=1 Tax=Monosiga brevicollis TaxID=81824 RepID=A9UVZ6_MONBE|nr:uncharacterized protein MONBRDRAFT_31877 [Monosiga brevicollis MX1]EDQ90475.1 predicted protein [Monosiga brevicollis MX1]|eukprot:XP_001744526.1 hypothetical protein [Monosiga brevicollis MX1]
MSSDEEMADEPVKGASKSLALRIQKKFLGMTVKSKGSIKNYIDDNSGELLDCLYDLALRELGDKKAAKKVLKDLIKVVVKLGLLYQKGQFNQKELTVGNELRGKFKMAILTMVSYYDVAFTFDAEFLCDLLNQCREALQALIARHLTDKSKGRVNNVFGFYGNGDVLTKLYNTPEYKDLLDNIIKCMRQMIADNVL